MISGWAGIEKGTLRGNWLGQLRPPRRADAPSGQRMDIRLARGSINLSFLKSRVQEEKKQKQKSFMHSGCNNLFPSCLPLSTGADVFTSVLLGTGNIQEKHSPCSHHVCTHRHTREQTTGAAGFCREIILRNFVRMD